MRRITAFPVVLALLLLTAVPASASIQRQTWDTSYSLTPDQFCGFAVDVHDYGWNVYRHVSEDGWSWDKTWQGTRAYTNPTNDMMARLEWTWLTVQTVENRSATTISLLYTSRGTTRVQAADGGVAASQAGRITFRRVLDLVDGVWVQVGGDAPVSWNGPHELDLGSAFCDAMIGLLDTAS